MTGKKMTDRFCFVQLPHPGGEHGPDGHGLKRWQLGHNAHKRKFMETPGAWREHIDGPVTEANLVFWGEWEADSTVEEVKQRSDPGDPTWLHRPFFEGAQNA